MNKTGISYLDFTWNPVTGCTFGCPECWARDVAQKRLAPAIALRDRTNIDNFVDRHNANLRDIKMSKAYRTSTPTLHPERLDQPAKRKKPAVIGVCFMGDLFDPNLEANGWSAVSHAAMDAPQHTYIFLTKKPHLMAGMYDFNFNWTPKPNWYIGFSARNQAEFDAGWPHMAKLAAAGWKVWVSLEPMQGPVDLEVCPGCVANCEATLCQTGPAIHSLSTVILGAQSGKNAVPLQGEWVEAVRDQCAAADIHFMFKQDNSTGKVVSLPELDGVQHTATAWSQP